MFGFSESLIQSIDTNSCITQTPTRQAGGNQGITAAEQQPGSRQLGDDRCRVSGLEFLNFDIAVQPLIQKKEREVFFQYLNA